MTSPMIPKYRASAIFLHNLNLFRESVLKYEMYDAYIQIRRAGNEPEKPLSTVEGNGFPQILGAFLFISVGSLVSKVS